jgi:hypothetical protein
MDETVEEDVVEEIKEEIKEQIIENGEGKEQVISEYPQTQTQQQISFNDVDLVKDDMNKEEQVLAPKSIDRLEQISEERNIQRKQLESDDVENNLKLNISDEIAELDKLDVHIINEPELEMLPDLIIDDIEILE